VAIAKRSQSRTGCGSYSGGSGGCGSRTLSAIGALGSAQHRARGAAPTAGSSVCGSRTLSAIGAVEGCAASRTGCGSYMGQRWLWEQDPVRDWGAWGLRRIAHGVRLLHRGSGGCGSWTLSAIGRLGFAQHRARGAAPTTGEQCLWELDPVRDWAVGGAQNRARGAAPTAGERWLWELDPVRDWGAWVCAESRTGCGSYCGERRPVCDLGVSVRLGIG
jgi:hypothetical protein